MTIALFAVIACGAGVLVARATVSTGHGCCAGAAPPSDDTAPCRGFLPLTCCQNAALPGSDSPLPAPQLWLIAAAETAAQPSLAFAIGAASAPLATRAPPARLSVVLQV